MNNMKGQALTDKVLIINSPNNTARKVEEIVLSKEQKAWVKEHLGESTNLPHTLKAFITKHWNKLSLH